MAMKQTPHYSDFTGGELSDKYVGRSDDPIYRKGGKHFFNMRPIPQGGFRDTGGSRFAASLSSGPTKYRAIAFSISEELNFLLCFGHTVIKIFSVDDDGSLTAFPDLTHGESYNDKALFEIQLCQNYNTLYLTHRNHPPKKLVYTAGTFSFSSLAIVTNEGETIPFQAADERPGSCAFFNGRLYLAGSTAKPQGVWVSRPYEPEDFTWFDTITWTEQVLNVPPTVDSEDDVTVSEVEKTKDIIRDSNAFQFEIASDKNDSIVSLTPEENLIIKTITSEWIVPDGTKATDIKAVLKSRHGSSRMQNMMIDGNVLVLQRDGEKLWEYRSNGQGRDLTFYSDHILSGGVYEYDYSRSPEKTVFFVKKDGTMAVLLYLPDRGIMSWFPMESYSGKYLSVAVVSTQKGDHVFTVNGNSISPFTLDSLWLERLDESIQVQKAVDVTFSAGTGAISPYYNGEDGLYAQGEGAVAVSGGVATAAGLNGTYAVGYGFPSSFETMDITAMGEYGESILKVRRIIEAFLYVNKGESFSIGIGGDETKIKDFTDMEAVLSGGEPMVITAPIRGGLDQSATLLIKRTGPYGLQVTSLMPELETNEI